MTELEKIVYAKSFIDKLASGVNPLDDTRVPDDDIVNNIRLRRCFSYVADVLGQVILNEKRREKRKKKTKKEYFSITSSELERFEYSETPITLSEFCHRAEALVDLKKMKKISRASLPLWLVHIGFLNEPSPESKGYAGAPTELGLNNGVTQISSEYGTNVYVKNALTLEAQKFIIDNFEAFLDFRARSKIKVSK